jgi:hypothetical protein
MLEVIATADRPVGLALNRGSARRRHHLRRVNLGASLVERLVGGRRQPERLIFVNRTSSRFLAVVTGTGGVRYLGQFEVVVVLAVWAVQGVSKLRPGTYCAFAHTHTHTPHCRVASETLPRRRRPKATSGNGSAPPQRSAERRSQLSSDQPNGWLLFRQPPMNQPRR